MEENRNDRVRELELKIKSLEEENKILRTGSQADSSKFNKKNIIDKLKENEERYIISQSLAKTGSWELKPGEERIWASDVMLDLIGAEKVSNDIALDDFIRFVHTDDRARVENALNELARGKNIDMDLKVVVPLDDEKETRYVQLTGMALKDSNDTFEKAIGVIKDITEFKKNIKEVTRAKDRAEESDKLKTSFLANMSHDLRTPMNAIIGYSELLNIGNTSPQNRKEYTQIIKSKGMQLLTLIDDIIEMSKFETGKQVVTKTLFNLHELLHEIKGLYEDKKEEIGKDIVELKLALPAIGSVEMIFTDSGRLLQVLGNLVDNGLKYTEKGSVEFGYELEDESKIRFFVRDTGKGLSKDKQKLIFNRFKNVEKTPRLQYTGSGLGLTISKRIIDMLGGKIWVESEENKGSVFYFTLPLTQPDEDYHVDSSAELPDLSNINWKNKVILIVEDEEINFKFLETVLHDTQAQVLYAQDGMQALDLCLSINKIDMILMDIKMPEMDGLEASKRIKQIRPDIPIIAQTAFATRDDKANSLKSGCDDYISKPIEIETLISKINKFFIEKDY